MKKKTTVVVSVLAVILIAVAGAIVFKSHQDNTAQNNNQKEETKMKKLPTITLKYGDEVIGKLDGYTMAMELILGIRMRLNKSSIIFGSFTAI